MSKRLLLFCISIILSSTYLLAGVKSVTIHDYVILRGKSTILLSDVAEFKNLDQQTRITLGKIKLGNAPHSGEKREFSNIAITEMIRGSINKLNKKVKSKISIKVPPIVMIENPKDLISQYEVKEKLLSNYKSLCIDCRFTIESLVLPKIPENIFVKSWELDDIDDLPRGSFQQALWIFDQSQQKRVFWITGSLKVMRQIPVAKRLIRYGERIQKEDVELKWKDISFQRNSVIPIENIIGQTVRGFLREGQFISAHNIEREKALKRGDIISVEVGSGEWSVKIKAVAEEDGYIGDTVKVKNTDTNKYISGVVVEKGKVKIE